MTKDIEIQQASQRVVNAVQRLTGAMTDSVEKNAEEIIACDWEVLRALAVYKDAMGPGSPPALTWVPPLLDIEDDGSHRSKVIQFATWVFSVTDEQRALVAGTERIESLGADDDDYYEPPTTAADVVGTLFDHEMQWPDIDEYQQMGLDIELVSYSTHTQLANTDDT